MAFFPEIQEKSILFGSDVIENLLITKANEGKIKRKILFGIFPNRQFHKIIFHRKDLHKTQFPMKKAPIPQST